MKLTKSGQDYLEAVLMIQNQKGAVREIDLVGLLGYSKPSVSVAVKKLRDAGFLSMGSDKLISLTDAGRVIAEKIYERHRFFTTALTALGIDPLQALPVQSSRPGQIQAGDLMLYGSDCLVLFYRSFSSSYSYTRLGHIENPADLASAVGTGNVQISFRQS